MSSNKEDHVWPGMADRVDVIREEKSDLGSEIKSKLAELFKSFPNVHAAYLVQLRYNQREMSVACALDMQGGETTKELREAISSVFRKTNHRTGEVLDILAIKGEMLASAKSKAHAFYTKDN
ncbi:MAG: enhanced serine sensitivity protein SseB C-terminal domain-containing protein [Armatimonadetes bacterium]|nr:enhanced serine sensitivity protein SseB C-terminal domain-containing protein [Armatimonadota bacterium]